MKERSLLGLQIGAGAEMHQLLLGQKPRTRIPAVLPPEVSAGTRRAPGATWSIT